MFRFAATSVLALGLAAPALADVTPAQVWENLQSYSADYGYQVTGTVDDAGGTLTVTDAVFSTSSDTGSSSVTFPKMIFRETGDARVRVVVEGDVALDSRFAVPVPAEDAPEAAPDGTEAPADPAPAETPETVEMTMTGTVSLPGNEMVVSGTPEDMLYEYSYPSVAFDFTLPAEPGQDATIPLTGTITSLAGSQRNVASDGGTASTFDLKAAQVAMRIDAEMPPSQDGAGGTIDLQVALTNLTSQGSGQTPGQSFDLGTQMAQALAAGLTLDTTLAFESLEGSFDIAGQDENGQDQTGQGSFASGASDIAVRLSGQGMGYEASVADNRAELTLNTVPFPISYAVQRISGQMQIPVTGGDAAQPFKLAYALEEVLEPLILEGGMEKLYAKHGLHYELPGLYQDVENDVAGR